MAKSSDGKPVVIHPSVPRYFRCVNRRSGRTFRVAERLCDGSRGLQPTVWPIAPPRRGATRASCLSDPWTEVHGHLQCLAPRGQTTAPCHPPKTARNLLSKSQQRSSGLSLRFARQFPVPVAQTYRRNSIGLLPCARKARKLSASCRFANRTPRSSVISGQWKNAGAFQFNAR